jgi:DHA3 family macrolide efflux protein-like MFS transporter
MVTASLSPPKNESSPYRRLLANRDYSRLWFGQLVSNIGTAISSLALLFYAYALTGSPMAMAILAIAQTAPVVLFAGFVGVYIDRWNRKTIMVVSDLVRAVLILLIPLSVYFPSIIPQIYWVYLLTFLYAIANAWFFPARNASIPNIVDSDELVSANSLSQMTFQVVQLTIPPLGGVLVAMLAPQYFLAFAINAFTFLLSAGSLYTIKKSLIPKDVINKESVTRQVVQGAKYVSKNPILVYFFVFAILLASSSGILNALLLPHLENQVGISEADFGIVLSVGAAMGTIVAIIMGKRKKLPYPLYIVSFAGIIAGIGVLIFAAATSLWIVIVSWALIGSVDVMLNIPLSTIMQDLVKDNYRGRVFALLNVVFTALQVLGMALGGVWAELAGSSVPPLFAAGLLFVITSVLSVFYVAGRKLHQKLDIMLTDSDVARDHEKESESSEVVIETAV